MVIKLIYSETNQPKSRPGKAKVCIKYFFSVTIFMWQSTTIVEDMTVTHSGMFQVKHCFVFVEGNAMWQFMRVNRVMGKVVSKRWKKKLNVGGTIAYRRKSSLRNECLLSRSDGDMKDVTKRIYDEMDCGFVGLIRKQHNPQLRWTGHFQWGPGWWITAHGRGWVKYPNSRGAITMPGVDTLLIVGLK